MKNLKLLATTVCIKMIDDNKIHYSIDTYPRVIDALDVDVATYIFESDFMDAYAGNGIDNVTHIESMDLGYIDFSLIASGHINNEMSKYFDNYNHTVLDF